MGKIKRDERTYGMFKRAMAIQDPEVRARLLQQATMKLQEYREANAGLSKENEGLKVYLDGALRYICELTGQSYPPQLPEREIPNNGVIFMPGQGPLNGPLLIPAEKPIPVLVGLDGEPSPHVFHVDQKEAGHEGE